MKDDNEKRKEGRDGEMEKGSSVKAQWGEKDENDKVGGKKRCEVGLI